MAKDVFAVPVFFIVFRETLEVAVICSVLLAFLKQTLSGPSADQAVYKKLVRQVWYGTLLGLLLCLIIGAGLIGAFYTIGKNKWSTSEYYWEASFSLLASLIISILGAALLRISKMQDKWRVKLATALESKPVTAGHSGRWAVFKRWCEKYAMFMLPFITVLREGLEAIIFIAGVSFSSPAAAVPLPVVCGLLAGCAAGYVLYKGGATSRLQLFLVVSTCLLYLVAAGLFSKAIWYIQAQTWNNVVGGDAAEIGAGPGSYDIDQSVWHINYGNPELNGGGGWGIFNALFGWTNSATYGSVISYNVYWIAVILGFIVLRFRETRGHLPFLKKKGSVESEVASVSEGSGNGSGVLVKEEGKTEVTVAPVLVREIS